MEVLDDEKQELDSEQCVEEVSAEDVPAVAEDVPVKTKSKNSAKKTVLTYLHDLVYLLAVVLVLFLVFFRVVVVSGPSMNNTLKDGDYLLLLNAIADTTNGDGLTDAAMLAGNDGAFEHLDTLTGAFLDLYVYTNSVANPHFGQFFLHVLVRQSLYQIHIFVLLNI